MLTRSALETQKLELLALVTELKRQHAVLERENIELRDRLAEERRRNKPPIMPRNSPFPATSTPNQVTCQDNYIISLYRVIKKGVRNFEVK